MPVVLASLALCLSFLAAPQTAAKPNPRANVATAVTEAIRLLEAKDLKTFLPQFIPPDELSKQAPTPEAFTTLVERFSARADRLLGALKDAQTSKPAYNETKTVATYTLKTPVGSKTTLSFMKIGAYWYILDRRN